jgi:hypothetical protein
MTVLPRAWPERARATAAGASVRGGLRGDGDAEGSRVGQGGEHLRGCGVVAGVLRQAECEVGLVGVEPLVLEGVGVEFVVQADATALLAQVEQNAAGARDPLDGLAQLGAAVAARGAEDVPGQALGVQPHQRGRGRAGIAQDEGDVLGAVGEAVEGDHLGGHGVPVGEAQGTRTLVRTVVVAGRAVVMVAPTGWRAGRKMSCWKIVREKDNKKDSQQDIRWW